MMLPGASTDTDFEQASMALTHCDHAQGMQSCPGKASAITPVQVQAGVTINPHDRQADAVGERVSEGGIANGS
jgi:Fe-S-cluster-containing dehydrogenase component